MDREFEPKLITVLREGYSGRMFLQDLLAGIVVAVVALPLAIAFAIASGVRPEQGLATAIVAGFTVSALGGTRVQIAGPTGAYIVIVYGIVQKFGYDGLAVATMMAGALLVALGVARLGSVIRFIPYPVTVGFTSGIALIIAAGQVHDALGFPSSDQPPDFLGKIAASARELDHLDARALAVCLATVLLIRLWPRISTRVPGPLVALLATTAGVHLLGWPIATIGSRFGEIPSALPAPRLPEIDAAALATLASSAVSIALLGGIESLLSAVVADGMTGRRHRSNAELIAQGVANIASPLFGGIPATGAIARTATNVKNGGRTPFAGMLHAAILLLILVFAGTWASLIPMATLAGILVIVAYNMSEWRLFLGLLRGPRSDVLVLLVTFLLTVLVDLTVAIQAGVVLAALLLMRRIAEVTQVRSVTEDLAGLERESAGAAELFRSLPPQVDVFEIHGAFVFGAAQTFSQTVANVSRRPRVVILRMQKVLAIDATGIRGLEEVLAQFRRQGATLLLAGTPPHPLDAIRRSGAAETIGEENILPDDLLAVERAKALVAEAAADTGRHRARKTVS